MKQKLYAFLLVSLALIILFRSNAICGALGWGAGQLLPAGLSVSYYADKTLSAFVCRRTERAVEKAYDSRYAAWRVRRSEFSARWEGFLSVSEDAEYQFYLQSDDGARLFIDGEKVIDRWAEHEWNAGTSGKKCLRAGRYPIKLEYYNEGGAGAIRLRWCGGPHGANTLLRAPYITKK